MTSLIKRLMGEGTRQVMEYEEESVHNVPAIAQNIVMSAANKVKHNILHVMTAPVIAPLPALLQNQAANPLHALLKEPNALVIK